MVKKMIYGKEYKISRLAMGICCGYKWEIISLGTHPCAYILIPPMHPLWGKSNIDLPVHGGVTYMSECIDLANSIKYWYIGWDYGHAGDYIGGVSVEGKKWHTSEIIKEVHDTCKYLKEVYDD